MLEEALKRDHSVHAREVGWRRSSAREGESRRASEERQASISTPTPVPSSAFGESAQGPDSASGRNSPAVPVTPVSTTTEERRFFKFRFTSTSTSSSSTPTARPSTPNGTAITTGLYHHLNSPSLPSLPAHAKEVEELNEQLQKERAAKKKVEDEKAALEAELEALSQALFEEVKLFCSVFSSFAHARIFTVLQGQQNGCYGTYKAGRDGGRAQGGTPRERSVTECTPVARGPAFVA